MRVLVERKNQLISLAELQAKPAALAQVKTRPNDRVVAFQSTTPVCISLNPQFYQSLIGLIFQHSQLPKITVESVSRSWIARNISVFLDAMRNQVAFNLIMNKGETPSATIISVDLYELLFDRLEASGLELSDVLSLAAEKQKDGSRQASVLSINSYCVKPSQLIARSRNTDEQAKPNNIKGEHVMYQPKQKQKGRHVM